MSGFVDIDLSLLPTPDAVEILDAAAIKQAMLDDLAINDPEFYKNVLESDPAVKVIETFAYRETLVRQRVNDGVRAVMLATSRGTNLDGLAAFYGVKRQVVVPGDALAVPPIPPTYEDDLTFRRRTQLSPEAMTTAGSAGSYKFHGLSAGETPTTVTVESPKPGVIVVTRTYDPAGFSAQVKDVSAVRTADGVVTVTVLSHTLDGAASAALLSAVTAHLSGKYVVPLTDNIIVQGATILPYSIDVALQLYNGPDAAAVIAEATASAQAYVDARHKLGDTVAITGIEGALHVAGVKNMTRTLPATDIVALDNQAPYCTAITLTVSP